MSINTPAGSRRPITLVVDDDPHIRLALRELLEDEGVTAVEAGDGKVALEIIGRGGIDLILLDLELPRISGIDVLRHVAEEASSIPVVIVSGRGTIRKAVAATKLGAFDFLEKPVDRDLAIQVVREVLARTAATRAASGLRSGLADSCGIVGSSEAIQLLLGQIARAAPTDAKILLIGESGTGKELSARAIHANSARRAGPFVAVNCAAIPESLIESELFGHERGAFTGAHGRRRGRIEQAHRGTLFLDEIGDMSLMTQAKILRVLDDGSIQRVGGEEDVVADFRLVAATHRDLEQAVELGDFRRDLFYRLSIIRIDLPPLRARRDDVPPLAESFVRALCLRERIGFRPLSPAASAVLMSHDWPGNVRELRNAVERLMVLGNEGPIEAGEVREVLRVPVPPESDGPSAGLRAARAEFERTFIQRSLAAHSGHMQETADDLGIDRSYLWKKMKRLGIP
ncbi:MAG TPA: sigma-54 dependent transcriptional regulator [Gemmatimonadaceae bacterium]